MFNLHAYFTVVHKQRRHGSVTQVIGEAMPSGRSMTQSKQRMATIYCNAGFDDFVVALQVECWPWVFVSLCIWLIADRVRNTVAAWLTLDIS